MWFFFYTKAIELVKYHQDNIPNYEPEPEEVQAGFQKFQKTFGSYAVIDRVARTINIPEDQLYKWSARRFWFKQLYLAWETHYQNEYNKLIMKRK